MQSRALFRGANTQAVTQNVSAGEQPLRSRAVGEIEPNFSARSFANCRASEQCDCKHRCHSGQNGTGPPSSRKETNQKADSVQILVQAQSPREISSQRDTANTIATQSSTRTASISITAIHSLNCTVKGRKPTFSQSSNPATSRQYHTISY